jgi:hypothetical protein
MDDKIHNLKMLYKQRSQIGKGGCTVPLFWIREVSLFENYYSKIFTNDKAYFFDGLRFWNSHCSFSALLFKSNPQHEVVLILNAVLQVMGMLELLFIYFKYRLWQSNKNRLIVFYLIEMVLFKSSI